MYIWLRDIYYCFSLFFGPENFSSGNAEIPIFIVITVNFSPATGGKKTANGIF